ncbi:Sugar phosphatase YidA [Lactobacillus helveticus]|nr:Sugar phosphatase YidA [Lactobacillus helveticus]
MAIKFIALDTDGTLLDSNGKILPSTKIAVKKALEQGIKVALCSGRPIAGLKHFMDELCIVGPNQYAVTLAVTLNGAITRTADGQVMTEDLVSNSFIARCLLLVKSIIFLLTSFHLIQKSLLVIMTSI